MKRRTCRWILSAILCMMLVGPVAAAQQGSLLLTNVEVPAALFPVADTRGIPTEEFAGTVDRLTQTELTQTVAKKLYQHVQDQELVGKIQMADRKQEIFFDSLDEGWYLVCSMGEKAEFAPFLICVPMMLGEKTVYDIQAEPKTDSPTDPAIPSDPFAPETNIPQTGAILRPKYLLLILGAVAIVTGLVEVIRGQEKHYE